MKKWNKLFLGLAMVVILASCNKDDPTATQFNKESKAIDAFLAANVDPYRYLIYDSYGDRIVINNANDVDNFGAPAHGDQFVHIRYKARLFPDTTQILEEGIIMDTVKNLDILGLKVGITSLLRGSVATLFIPSVNAYGKKGTSKVAPNTTIVYDISIDSVIRKTTETTQFKLDTATVHKYVDTIQNVSYHPAGFWYSISAQGSDVHPTPYQNCNLHYKTILLSNGSLIEEDDLTASPFQLFDALKLGIPMIGEGGKATYYIPSALAYGSQKRDKIPVNSNLIMVIQLNSVVSK